MSQAEYCKYSEGKRGKRRYYSHTSFKELTLDRLNYNYREFDGIIRKVESIQDKIKRDNSKTNQEILDFLNGMLIMYNIILELYKEFEGKTRDKLEGM
jgi:hypothetical protein